MTKQEKDTDMQRRELLAMIQGKDIITSPALGVHFDDTGETYYFKPPTPAQLKIPMIAFTYESKEHWLAKADEDSELYNKYGELVLKRNDDGKAEE